MPTLGKPTNRRRIGGDVFLANLSSSPRQPSADDQTVPELRIDTGFAVGDWKPRAEATPYRAAFSGTAVQVDERWYEIVHAETSAGAPRRTCYYLQPWNDTEVFRHVFELTPQACQDLTQKHREQQQRRRSGAALSHLPLLVGLLPGEDQKRLENAYGFSAQRCTFYSAATLLFLSVLLIMTAFAFGNGMHFGALQDLVKKLTDYSPLAWYFAIESILRLGSLSGNEPIGSLPVVLVVYLVRGIRGAATAPRRAAEKGPTALAASHDTLTARDHMRRVGEQIEILSRLPKDHWTANVTGIEIDGEAYLLIEREVIQTDRGPRHRFVLQKPEHEALFKSYVRYHPEEVRDIYRREQRRQTAMWVETVPFFWGLLDLGLQNRLGRIYNYDPLKWTRWTANFEAAFGIFFLLGSLWQLTSDLADGTDAGALLLGIFLLWEGLLRKSKLGEGEIRGSLFGLPFAPLARWFLRWE
ncbi:MAG: hypothetical protein AAF657_34010 [Acidobacteriota bacterium]